MIARTEILVLIVSFWGLIGLVPEACAQAEPKPVMAVSKSVSELSARSPLAAVKVEDFDKKVIEHENKLLDVRITNMNFWFTFLTIFLAVLAALIGFLAWWVPRMERKQLTDKLLEARDTLAQAKEHLSQARDASEKATAAASEAIARAEDTERARDKARVDAEAIEMLRTQQVDKPLTTEAKEVAQKVATDDATSTLDTLRAQAFLAQQRKDWLSALDFWQALTRLGDKSGRAHFGVAYCLRKAVDEKLIPPGDDIYQRIQDNYAKATQLNATDSSSFNNWGSALSAQARTKQGEEADRLFTAAIEKHAKAIELDPKNGMALNSWGATLSAQARTKQGEEAERLLVAAIEKYVKAIELDPKNDSAFYNWGAALSAQAQTKQSEDRTRLFQEAERVLNLAKAITRKGTYNLACVYALTVQLEKCRAELEQCLADGTLPNANHLREDKDLEGVRREVWFLDLVSRAERKD